MTTEDKEKYVMAIRVNKNNEQCVRLLNQYAEAYAQAKHEKITLDAKAFKGALNHAILENKQLRELLEESDTMGSVSWKEKRNDFLKSK